MCYSKRCYTKRMQYCLKKMIEFVSERVYICVRTTIFPLGNLGCVNSQGRSLKHNYRLKHAIPDTITIDEIQS